MLSIKALTSEASFFLWLIKFSEMSVLLLQVPLTWITVPVIG